MKKVFFCLLVLFMLASCKRFLFHPNEISPDEALNSYNIEIINIGIGACFNLK
jgi:hypothetical protein